MCLCENAELSDLNFAGVVLFLLQPSKVTKWSIF